MKGRSGNGAGGGGGNGGGPPADLLVCFPSRAHLTLMPKPICSPSRPTDPPKRHQARASPLFRTRTRNMPPPTSDVSEPTSPKVTCAGQIKVRSKPKSRSTTRPIVDGDNWLVAMEEMEKLHGKQLRRRRPHWLDTLGIKKDIMHFLNAFRGLRFNINCFGSFVHGSVDCTSDEEDEEEEEGGEEEGEKEGEDVGSRNIFSKWFMVLEENQQREVGREEQEEEEEEEEQQENFVAPASSVPPPNALLLMRCKSAPAKGLRVGDREGAEEGRGGELCLDLKKKVKEEEKEKERLVLMSYAPDFFKLSSDIAKETWVVGSMDPLTRSRSWKR